MGNTVFTFPGQGSQSVGMGKDLFDRYDQAATILQEASGITGYDVRVLCLNGPEERLNQTKYTQVAMFVVNFIAGEILKSRNVSPSLVMGHSLGEYNALVAAGVLGFVDALSLVIARASLMQKAASNGSGRMLAVLGLEDPVVETAAEEHGVYVANYNCPGQVVISGEAVKIDAIEDDLKRLGARKIVRLNVSGAFHSPLMQPAAEEFLGYIEDTTFTEATVPVISNATGRAGRDKNDIKESLAKQMTGPVRWRDSIETALVHNATEFIEAGPGKVLSGLEKRITADRQGILILHVSDY